MRVTGNLRTVRMALYPGSLPTGMWREGGYTCDLRIGSGHRICRAVAAAKRRRGLLKVRCVKTTDEFGQPSKRRRSAVEPQRGEEGPTSAHAYDVPNFLSKDFFVPLVCCSMSDWDAWRPACQSSAVYPKRRARKTKSSESDGGKTRSLACPRTMRRPSIKVRMKTGAFASHPFLW